MLRRVKRSWQTAHMPTRLDDGRSTLIDVAAAVGLVAGISSVLLALVFGVVPIVACSAVAIGFLAAKRTRPVGVWTTAGVALTASALTVCLMLFALGGGFIDG